MNNSRTAPIASHPRVAFTGHQQTPGAGSTVVRMQPYAVAYIPVVQQQLPIAQQPRIVYYHKPLSPLLPNGAVARPPEEEVGARSREEEKRQNDRSRKAKKKEEDKEKKRQGHS